MSSTQARREELIAEMDREIRQMSAQSVLLSQAIADRIGLNPTDLECLDALLRMGPVPAGRLAELTGLTTGAITGVVDRLERHCFARRERDTKDRRRVIVAANPEAIGRITPLYQELATGMSELLDRYDDEQLALIIDFVRRANQLTSEHIARLRAAASPDGERTTPRADA